MSEYCPDCGGTTTDHYDKCANKKLQEALADVERLRVALHEQVADFRSCNRARRAAEDECDKLRTLVVEAADEMARVRLAFGPEDSRAKEAIRLSRKWRDAASGVKP